MPNRLQGFYRSPRFLTTALIAGSVMVMLSGCQQKMATQPSYGPLESSELFLDGNASRPLVANTVFRGDLRDDDALHTGKLDGKLVEKFPLSITQEVIERGQQRFNIYCSPCHSKLGDGNGMVVQRGVTRPPSFHADRLSTAPVGHFYDVITNGFGRMQSYDHLPVRDRWAIVAYIKALQISQSGTINDVPASERAALESMTTAPAILHGGPKHTADAAGEHKSTGGAH